MTDSRLEWATFVRESKVASPPYSQTRTESDTAAGTFADLAALTLIECGGADAQSFLQSQLTSDVAKLLPGHWHWSGYCNPKGRLLATFRVARHTEGFGIEAPAAISEALVARLRKYVLRAKVSFVVRTDDRFGIGILGAESVSVLRDSLSISQSLAPHQALFGTEYALLSLGNDRHHVYASPRLAKTLWHMLRANPHAILTAHWQLHDVAAGEPWIYAETQELFVPQMVDLDVIGGVSFEKGCYPGQEIVARSRYIGEVKRRLHHAHTSGTAAPARGELVQTEGGPIGHVLESAASPQGGYEVLVVIDIEAARDAKLALGQSGAVLDSVRRMEARP